MRALSPPDLPAEQLDQLDGLAEAAAPQLRVLLQGVSRSLREGSEIVALDAAETFTPSEAAQQLGMSRTHLYKLLDRGELPAHRVGRDRRIRAADLLQFEARRDAARRELAERFAHHEETEAALIDEIADQLPD